MASVEYTIVGGPSREEFFDHVRLGTKVGWLYFVGQQRIFRPDRSFLECGEVRFKATIKMVGWEDDSGESWYFSGYLAANPQKSFQCQRVSGSFNTKTRKGTLKVLE
jgi:hypothetical protein